MPLRFYAPLKPPCKLCGAGFEHRVAVVLRDMESLSYEEIATVLELPIGTVRSRIHRGRLLLQDMLQEFR